MEKQRENPRKWWFNGILWDIMGYNPLVMTNIAVENGYLYLAMEENQFNMVIFHSYVSHYQSVTRKHVSENVR